MALLDNEELQDEVEKNRLFDTVKGEGRSVRHYLKVMVPVVAAVVIIGGGIVYFMSPGVGDEVRPPDGLADAVKAHFQDREKRAVTDAVYFLCEDFHSARVTLETRPDITARKMDDGKRLAAAAERSPGQWEITSAVDNETAPPCTRKE